MTRSCDECEERISCDIIGRFLSLIAENCIDNHFNTIVREHTEQYLNRKKEPQK